MATQKKMSEFSAIQATDETTYIPVITGSPLANKVISVAALHSAVAPKSNPTFTGSVKVPSATETTEATNLGQVNSIAGSLSRRIAITDYVDGTPTGTPIYSLDSIVMDYNTNTLFKVISTGPNEIGWSSWAVEQGALYVGRYNRTYISSESGSSLFQIGVSPNIPPAVQVVANLNSTDDSKALAASQGRLLNSGKANYKYISTISDGLISPTDAIMTYNVGHLYLNSQNMKIYELVVDPLNEMNLNSNIFQLDSACLYRTSENLDSTFYIVDNSTSSLIELATSLDIDALAPKQGTAYRMVYGVGTPTDNAVELQAVYNEAKKLPRYLGNMTEAHATSGTVTIYAGQTFQLDGLNYWTTPTDYSGGGPNFEQVIEAFAKAMPSIVTVVVAPGIYTFGATKFAPSTGNVNIVSLSGNSDVMLDGINIQADNIFIKGINCGSNVFALKNYIVNFSAENCIATGANSYCSSTFTGCRFKNVVGAENAFMADGFTDCSFDKCTGRDMSFHANTFMLNTKFKDCDGFLYSFDTDLGGTITNVYIYRCIGGDSSFFVSTDFSGSSNSRIYNCIAGSGSGISSFNADSRFYNIENNIIV